MIFDMDDFDKTEQEIIELYNESKDVSDVEFVNSLMTITSMLRTSNFQNRIKGGVDMMMKSINMSCLDDEYDSAIFLISGLVTHLYRLLEVLTDEDRYNYFNSFEQRVIQPMLDEINKGK